MSGRNLIRGLTAFAVLAALVWMGLGEADMGSQERVRLGVVVYTAQHPGEDVPVIVRVREGTARAGGQLAGSVETSAQLPLIDGFAATLPPTEIDRLARDPAVLVVSLDAEMMASGNDDDQDGTSDLGVAYPFAVNAVAAWDEGISGEGITVAVIAGEADAYTGIAPGAQILSLKVADREGRALASDVVAALQWAVDHRDEYDIRVANSSSPPSPTATSRTRWTRRWSRPGSTTLWSLWQPATTAMRSSPWITPRLTIPTSSPWAPLMTPALPIPPTIRWSIGPAAAGPWTVTPSRR